MSKRFINVAAGLLIKPDGQLLLAQRPGDKQWSGWWELPGGKIEHGETSIQALTRELQEELDITVTEATPWVTYIHDYPSTIVSLAFHRVTGWNGEPRGAEGQRLAWTRSYATPSVAPLLPATKPPLRWLDLPDRYLLTSIGQPDGLSIFLDQLHRALSNGVRLVQFREPEWASIPDQNDAIHAAFLQVLAQCRQHGAYCLVNSIHPQAWWEQADGVHYRAQDAASTCHAMTTKHADLSHPLTDVPAEQDDNNSLNAPDTARAITGALPQDHTRSHAGLPGALRPKRYIAMSAHTSDDLKVARQLHADFVVLGHVLDTPSHARIPGMGWDAFSELNGQAGLPVFAIGGQSAKTAATARQHGAHGIAGMRQLIKD